MDENDETNRPPGARSEKVAGQLLPRLGAKLSAPLTALVSEIHDLDARGDDDATAHLVELAHELRAVVEPLTTLATLESRAPVTEWTQIELRGFLTETMQAPDLAASFRLTLHGELGTSWCDAVRLRQGLKLCLELLSGMTKDKTRLHVHREVHEPADRVVLTTRLFELEPVALGLARHAAHALDASFELDGQSLSLGFPVGTPEPTGVRPEVTTPVLAFRKDDSARDVESEPRERAAIVLVVDDEPAARAYLSRLLELEGFDVVGCTSLEQAEEAAHSYRPDVIILDRFLLAQHDGDWVRRIRAEPGLRRTPLVLMQSAESDALGLVNIAEVVRKPIDRSEVVATLGRLTGAGSPPIFVIRNPDDAAKWERCLVGQTRVVMASSVSEADRLLDAVTPSTLIADVSHGDGIFELLEVFRRGDGEHVPMIAVHGRLTKKDRLRLVAIADARLTHSELNRRSLAAALLRLDVGERRQRLGAG